ncbi:MAG TPA: 30S ribosome-binding factor RbfA [Pyrinomonadaceae bacterium]|nr:30S ribosome-binding factor RbfA [Pyrinomonadaceae bacterium]
MRRPEQLAELIRAEVSQIVGYELDDPRVETVTVTDVRVSENLRDASVYVTAVGTEAEKVAALKALQKAAPYVRRQLSILLNLRYTPELHFVRDTVEESATRVDELLTQLGTERQDRPDESGEVVIERDE